MVQRASWLSVTPEPERELPEAVATLTRGGPPLDDDVARERGRIERVILHGSRRQWFAYLRGVIDLIARRADAEDPAVARARALATAVISNHHNLLLALPGRAAEWTAADRARLRAVGPPSKGHQ
jgi:hypothetical protein